MNTTTTSTPPPGQRFLLSGMSWDLYEHLLTELDHRPIRVTYDRGLLELRSPAYRHENDSRMLGRMVQVLAEELDIPIKSAGSTTFRRESLERGLEPDECFYISHLPQILGKEELDLETDPPPDLAIEVDITHASVDRLPLYADLGVPELWRFDGSQLFVYHLQETGEYSEPQTESLAFLRMPPAGFVDFLVRASHTDDVSLLKEFREWVRGVIQ